MRLIDADALKGQIRETIKVYKTNGMFDEPLARFCKLLKEEIKAIANAPTIDAEPVKHGKWGKAYRKTANGVDFLVLSCSECDNADPQMNYYDFCPNCGAKMKGQEE